MAATTTITETKVAISSHKNVRTILVALTFCLVLFQVCKIDADSWVGLRGIHAGEGLKAPLPTDDAELEELLTFKI